MIGSTTRNLWPQLNTGSRYSTDPRYGKNLRTENRWADVIYHDAIFQAGLRASTTPGLEVQARFTRTLEGRNYVSTPGTVTTAAQIQLKLADGGLTQWSMPHASGASDLFTMAQVGSTAEWGQDELLKEYSASATLTNLLRLGVANHVRTHQSKTRAFYYDWADEVGGLKSVPLYVLGATGGFTEDLPSLISNLMVGATANYLTARDAGAGQWESVGFGVGYTALSPLVGGYEMFSGESLLTGDALSGGDRADRALGMALIFGPPVSKGLGNLSRWSPRTRGSAPRFDLYDGPIPPGAKAAEVVFPPRTSGAGAAPAVRSPLQLPAAAGSAPLSLASRAPSLVSTQGNFAGARPAPVLSALPTLRAAAERIPNLKTGVGYGAGDPPVRIKGDWSINDMKQGLLGHPPRGLGSPDLHHGGQMPGAAKHEILPLQHRNNPALHPNKANQGVTPEMRQSDRQLHWWYRAREQGADQLLPDWIYD